MIQTSKQTDILLPHKREQTDIDKDMSKQMKLVENSKLASFFVEEDEHYFKGQNGNIYNKHCFYSNSKAVYAQQIHNALATAFGHYDGFYVNSVVNSAGVYQGKSFFWIDNIDEAYKLLTGEVVLPPIELLPEQQAAMGCRVFHLTYSPKFYSHNLSPDDIKNQLYIGKLPNDNVADLQSMLKSMFSRYAVSDNNRLNVEVCSCKSNNTNYAIVTFKDPLDCSFAIDMCHKCVIKYKDRQYPLSVRNAKNNFTVSSKISSSSKSSKIMTSNSNSGRW
jgi:hypothetical protein